jgi:hypothetical protein
MKVAATLTGYLLVIYYVQITEYSARSLPATSVSFLLKSSSWNHKLTDKMHVCSSVIAYASSRFVVSFNCSEISPKIGHTRGIKAMIPGSGTWSENNSRCTVWWEFFDRIIMRLSNYLWQPYTSYCPMPNTECLDGFVIQWFLSVTIQGMLSMLLQELSTCLYANTSLLL